jgi:hypothetical protein
MDTAPPGNAVPVSLGEASLVRPPSGTMPVTKSWSSLAETITGNVSSASMKIADLTGTLADGSLTIVSNVISPGLIRVVVYGATPVTMDGVYDNLRFTVTASAGASSLINIIEVRINNGENPITTAAGRVAVR